MDTFRIFFDRHKRTCAVSQGKKIDEKIAEIKRECGIE